MRQIFRQYTEQDDRFRAVKLEKTALSLVLFIAFFGVVGGIESGALTMLAGILICAVISLFEYATLKSLFKRVK